MDSSRKSLEPRVLARLSGLHLRARHIVEGFVAGLHRSPYRGYSIEFAEHREYAPGDDLRYLDWKAYGRTDKFYLKQFEDETNLLCSLIVDTSESMRYAGPDSALTKYEYASCLAASLAWLVLQQQDAVGLATFDDSIKTLLRPSNNPGQLQRVVDVLEHSEPAARTACGPIFRDLADRMQQRSVVVIISDLIDDPQATIAGIRRFRQRQHDVIVWHVMDDAEIEFPFRQTTKFRGLEAAADLLVDARAVRKAYREEMQEFLRVLQSECRSQGIDYCLFRTGQPVDLALSEFLGGRMQRVR